MTQLRHPRATATTSGIGVDVGRGRLPSPNRLVNAVVCDGCPWPARCGTDELCWRAEKADIAAERLA